MLLRNRLTNWTHWIAVGQILFVLGALGLLFVFLFPPSHDFLRGFVTGFSGTLVGTSLVFNLRGLVLRRRGVG
jgi:hypothetical protein